MKKLTCEVWNNVSGWHWTIESRGRRSTGWSLQSDCYPCHRTQGATEKHAKRVAKRFGLPPLRFVVR